MQAMKFSTVPFLFIMLIVLFTINVRRVRIQGKLDQFGARMIYFLIVILVCWGIASSTLAITGVYLSPSFLTLLPGFWLPFVPFILAIGGVLIFSRLRSALRRVVDHTPWHWLVFIHTPRVLAIGTIIKAINGEFPKYFALLVGIPDLLFGLSAFFLGIRMYRRPISRRALILWNLIGVAVILPAAPLFQMGLSGPIQIFTSQPTAERMLEFPMVLAPSLVVPMFVLLNNLVAWRLIENTHPTKKQR